MNESDLYPALTDNNPFRICCLSVNVVSMVVGVPLLFGIVWFERFGSDKKRTILNMLISEVIWTFIVALALVQIPDLVRFTLGPLPRTVCFLLLLLRNYLACTIVLLFTSTSVSRFVFIFCLKNPAAFQDDFWFRFSSLVIHLFSQLFWGTLHFINTNQPVIYYICTGENSEEAIRHPFKGYGIIETSCVIVNAFVYIKIYFYKQKIKQQPHTHFNSQKVASLFEIEKENLGNFIFVVLSITLIISSTFSVAKLNSINAKDINVYPNYLFVFYRNLLFQSFVIVFFIVWFYAKKNLRKKVLSEILSLF